MTRPRPRSRNPRPRELDAAIEQALEAQLRALGIIGVGRVALPLLGAVVLGEPVLLVGAHGTAKTTLVQRLARALGADVVRVYDAAKAFLEDVLGFPVPQSLADGEVRYARTPLSIEPAHAVIVDELSRATPPMQSKWLEVIRARTIMGLPLPNLRFVFAAMNPTGYEGTFPLDEALAGRFVAIVRVPEAQELTDDERCRVIAAVGEQDAPALTTGRDPPPDGAALRAAVEAARARLSAIEPAERAALVAYANVFGRVCEQHECPLDGRRLGMLHRLLGASLAVARTIDPTITLEDASPLLLRAAQGGVPWAATGKDVEPPVLRAAHEQAYAAATGRREGALGLPADPLKLADALATAGKAARDDEARIAITRLIERTRGDADEADARSKAIVGLCLLARAITAGTVKLRVDDQQRVLAAVADALQWPDDDPVTVLGQEASDVGLVARATGEALVQTSLRVALTAATERSGPFPTTEASRAARLADDVKTCLEAVASCR